MLQKVLQTFIQPKAKHLLAIDISCTAVKLLQLSRRGERLNVDHFAVAPLKQDAVVDKVIKDSAAVATAIQSALEKARCSTREAAVAIPDSIVVTRWLTMVASLNEDEIEDQLLAEADKYISYPIEEISLDFHVRWDSEQNGKVEVLLVASRKENVESRIEALSAAGLNLSVVDVESYATERACSLMLEHLPNRGMGITVAVFDIGSVMTNLTVLRDMEVIFSREEVFGGEQLTREIQRYYNLSYEEAGLGKKTGNLPDDYQTEVLRPFKDNAVLQIRRALQFFFSATDYNQVDYLILAGGTAHVPGLCDLISKELEIPALIADPFANMSASAKVNLESLHRDSASSLICCGLALRGIQG